MADVVMGGPSTNNLIEITADVVSAYVNHNSISATDLPGLIADVHSSLVALRSPAEQPAPELKPAVPLRKSVTPDFIICLEDGKKFKSLKRHIQTQYGLTPAEYREKWGLPPDYPMVAPNYSATRSQLARENGLGRKPAPKIKRSGGVRASS
jgi:predicted transcriptional regulator